MTTRPAETIELGDVCLMQLRADDAAAVAAAVAASLEHLAPWMPWAGPAAGDVEHQRARAAQTEQAWQDGTEFVYALRQGAGVIGMFGLHRRIGPGAIEIGYWMHIDHGDRGHATAAAGALTEQARVLDGIERVEIHTDEANVRSAAIPRRLGYQLDRVDVRDPEAPSETGRMQIWIHPA